MTISDRPLPASDMSAVVVVAAAVDARAVLDHPLLAPDLVPGRADASPGPLAWLRATVARFTGDPAVHARRRALAGVELARLDLTDLRSAAAGSPVDSDDRHTVVRVLADGLGLPDPDAVAEAVVTVSAGYFGAELTAAETAVADQAVVTLLRQARTSIGAAEEAEAADDAEEAECTAQRIGLLVQACDATARLVEHARRAAPDPIPAGAADALLADALRRDPPVTALRRRASADVRVGGRELREGTVAVVDVAAAQRASTRDSSAAALSALADADLLVFGAGPHHCPGRAQAQAIAAGMLARENPAALVTGAVDRALDLAATWPAWDGRPVAVEDRVYTPHKAVRRIADHLVDHLAELEARLAGEEPQPDHWHASATTTPADLAPFTAQDLDEARSRLIRLGRIWADRLGALSDAQLDHSPGEGWSFRKLAAHTAGSLDYYAGAVGRLGPAPTTVDH